MSLDAACKGAVNSGVGKAGLGAVQSAEFLYRSTLYCCPHCKQLRSAGLAASLKKWNTLEYQNQMIRSPAKQEILYLFSKSSKSILCYYGYYCVIWPSDPSKSSRITLFSRSISIRWNTVSLVHCTDCNNIITPRNKFVLQLIVFLISN